jgi:hypothetical protein
MIVDNLTFPHKEGAAATRQTNGAGLRVWMKNWIGSEEKRREVDI